MPRTEPPRTLVDVEPHARARSGSTSADGEHAPRALGERADDDVAETGERDDDDEEDRDGR